MRFSEDQFRSMVEQGPAVVYIDSPDESASSVYISPQIEALLGFTPQEWYDDRELWPKVLHPDDKVRAMAENARHNETGEPFSLEYRIFHKDGHVVWVHDEATMVRDGRGMSRFSHGVMMDISDRKRGDADVAFLAYHDELTGLPSRSMFEELLELSLARARRHEGSVAVACVDVDDFRLVNDSLGHASGDQLLKMVAHRLREATRETDLVARRGGDQFLMLIADLERESTGDMDTAVVRAEAAAQRVQQAMTAPFEVGGTEVYLSVSVGISLFPQDADDAGGLQRNADAAMYESKKVGPCRLRRVFSGGVRFGGQAAVRHPSAQGGRESTVGAALPTGGGTPDRQHDGRGGADPLDRTGRHDGATDRVHPARGGARADRVDR